MSYLLNISFVFPEKIEQRFVLWMKNSNVLEACFKYRVIGKTEGDLTYCAQLKVDSISEIQQKTSELHVKLHTALKNDFNEEVIFFMSALESI